MTPPIANNPGLNAQTPLLLLPVHIQTRFIDGANGQSELWVRIYPDQIAVNSHEPELTAQEVSDGQAYWNALWPAAIPPADSDAARAPWRVLAAHYGSQRAAWIALALTPTNLTQQPTPASPVFPIVTQRDSSWEKPATADALPDAWTVVLVSGTQVSTFRSSPVVTPLAVSLTPNGTGFPAGSHVDAGLQWMVDFPTAVAAGMAMQIPLTAAQRASGFDRIYVYGTRATDKTPAQTITDLLNAHHYTDGFAIVPQGAPTNNTPDISAAYSSKDPDYSQSFSAERESPLTTNPSCDGNVLLNAVSLAAGTLDHVEYADGTGCTNGSNMLQALWPATLGYFLSQMMADVFTPAEVEQARQYVTANGLPRGPIPAFRVGRTPYGVLPVTSLRNYPAEQTRIASVESGLATFVNRLWQTWLNSSSTAPHMQRGGDPDQNLMSVLGMDASSENFQGRPVLGSDFTWNLFSFFGIPQPFQGQWWQNYFLFGRELLNQFGYTTWNPKLLGFAFDVNSFPVGFPTVQSTPLSETAPLAADADLGGGTKGNYIQWLASASVADLQAENYPGPKPSALLYKILRQSMLRSYANSAGTAEVAAGTLTVAQLKETELLQVQPSVPTLTPLQVLARPATPNPHLAWADYLVSTTFAAGSQFAALTDLRNSLAGLAQLPTAELDRLLTETLDACSHRLDVWATAIANALLKRTRAAQNASINLGCYGWVEDVHAEAGRTPVQGTELRQVGLLDSIQRRTKSANADLPVPVQPLTDNGGYVLAPSQTQAAVAAVLRNGYMTHKQTAEEGLLSIDLSSERVRKAIWLIEGVQQGQSINALLGYLFEDAMHDQHLDKYIQAFRDAYPVVGSKLTPSSAPTQAVAASNVVDGLALRTAWDNGKLAAGGNWGVGLPAPGADQNSVITILETVDDYADALGDLSIAEAVFQAVRGNFGGAALMDAISRGSRPPLPEIVNTPRGGLDLTHRIQILIAGAPASAAQWAGITTHPRAAAEPWLDAWLSTLIPDPASVRSQAKWQDSGGAHTAIVSLRDLDIGPLDLLSLADAAEVPQRSELECRILFAAAISADAQNVQISFDAATLPRGSFLFPDVLFLALNLRTLIGAARALTPQDLTVPERNAVDAGGAANLVDLSTRATAALTSLNNDTQSLIAAATPADIRTALMRCSYYGVPGSLPLSANGADANLTNQVPPVVTELQKRYTQASAINLATAQPADFQNLFQTIFGTFLVLPRLTPPDLATLQNAFSQSSALVSPDPVAPARWFRQLTHVHPAASRFDMALSTAQAFSDSAISPPSFTIGQIPPPATPPDRWLGLPLDPAHPPEKGRVAIEGIAAGDPTTQSVYAGLLIDEWNERIPVVPTNASLAFHYEEPSARAPQSLLLAVCPDSRSTWDDALIQAILQETLDLAHIRTVDLASIETVGQILPALYFALNLQGATISTRFAVLKEAIGGIGNIATGFAG
jgi:hypothetical protein